MSKVPRFGLFGTKPSPPLPRIETTSPNLKCNKYDDEEVLILSSVAREPLSVPSNSKPFADRAQTDRVYTVRAQTDRAPAERAQTDRAPTDRALAGRAQTERAPTCQPPAERVQIERAQTERAQTERAPSERAPSERAPSVLSPELIGSRSFSSPPAANESEKTDSTGWSTPDPQPASANVTPVKRAISGNPLKRLRRDLDPELTMNAAGPRQMKQLQALYEGQRDAYLKYKDLADKAAKKMHQTVLMMMQAMDESLEQPVCSAEMSPELVSSRNAGTTRIPPSALRMPERYISSDSSELPEARSLLGRDSLGISGPRSAPVASKAVLPPPLADNTVDASNNLGLCVRDAPSRPYQFTTRRLDAFKLKPRAALTCKFEGSDSEVSVAYGMDGTVQLWSPKEKRLLQKLDSSTLGMDFAEHLTQVTPSLLVAVSGERTKLGSLRNPGQLFFLNQAASGSSAYPRLQNAEQLNVLPESDLISVAEGMVGANTHEDSGLLLTGGQRDRKVYIWALDKSEGRVTAVEKRLLVKTRHTSRISALCYEPFHNFVLSGSDSGRVNIGCAETGREITVDNGEKVPPNVVGKLLVCPTNPNLVLASIGATKDQMRIFDIRGKLSIQRPALVLGQQRERTQSRYLRPAWHPHGDLIFYPFLRGSTETSHEGMVAIWDVRFKRCADTAPQVFHPHKEDVWSVNFAESSNANQHTMVTVSTDRSIGFTDFML